MVAIDVQQSVFMAMEDSAGETPASVLIGTSPVTPTSPNTAAPTALPTVTGGTSIESYFANEGTFTPTGGFDTSSNMVGSGMSNSGYGVELTEGSLSHSTGDYKIGLGTHYEDMVVMFQVPVTSVTFLLGNDNQATSRGKLQIAFVSGVWRFQWVQREAGGASDSTYTFSTITVPITESGAGVARTPFYLRVFRQIPASTGSGDQGQINLIVNDGTTEQSETITPVDRLDTGISGSDARFGGSTAFAGDIGTLTCFWHRAIWSDTPASTPFDTTRWSDPTVYDPTPGANVFLSTTNTAHTYLDSGADDQYWQAFGFPGSPLAQQGGGRLKARFAATNVQGSESFGIGTTTLQNATVEELPDLQGRYLAIETTYEIGADWPMSMGAPYLLGVDLGPAIGTAVHDPSPHVAGSIVIGVPGEAASGGTLPLTPEHATKMLVTARSKLERFESPYSVGYALGTKTRRRYRVSWTLTDSERSTLEAFFLARDGGEESFTWTAPGDSTTSKAALASELNVSRIAPDVFFVSATVEEVF